MSNLRLMRHDKLWEQRRQKNDAFRVGKVDQNGTTKQLAAGQGARQRMQIE